MSKSEPGRPVQLCHSAKSYYMVEKILRAFNKEGKRDEAEFWINADGRTIRIRYSTVRDNKGEYLGTIEAIQDVTEIKRLKEKKTPEWS